MLISNKTELRDGKADLNVLCATTHIQRLTAKNKVILHNFDGPIWSTFIVIIIERENRVGLSLHTHAKTVTPDWSCVLHEKLSRKGLKKKNTRGNYNELRRVITRFYIFFSFPNTHCIQTDIYNTQIAHCLYTTKSARDLLELASGMHVILLREKRTDFTFGGNAAADIFMIIFNRPTRDNLFKYRVGWNREATFSGRSEEGTPLF